MARKKKTEDWLDGQVKELNEAFSEWPKITVGSHSTRTEYEDGRVDFVWDWEALQRDVRNAIASYENRMNCETPEVQAPAKRTRKKQ